MPTTEKHIGAQSTGQRDGSKLQEPPSELLEKRAELELQLERLPEIGRQKIRAERDLQVELAALNEAIDYRKSGNERREYLMQAEKYLKTMRGLKDNTAHGEMHNTLLNLSNQQMHNRYRKRSDLNRAIRMASRVTIDQMQQHAVLDEFLSDFHKVMPPVYLMHGDLCPECNEVMVKHGNGGSLVCRTCGLCSTIQDSTSGVVSFSDDVEYANFTYKRGNHFQEWVNTTMAKQNCDVPEDVKLQVMKVLVRDRVAPDSVNARRVREVLKELKLRKWYEHAMLIACILTGREPPRMTPDMEDQLKLRFSQIQEPFEIYRETIFPDRKNFLSYSYVLYKLCELEDLEDFKQCFSLLKGRDKLFRQDQLWKAICNHLDWKFVPSI